MVISDPLVRMKIPHPGGRRDSYRGPRNRRASLEACGIRKISRCGATVHDVYAAADLRGI